MKEQNNTIQFTKQEARKFVLSHHFLYPPKSLTSKENILTLFERLGCIQFDTINVIGRNADLVLQSRIKDYTPAILEAMLYKDRLLVDGFDKVASIYPSSDWPYFSRHRKHLHEYYEERAEEPRKVIPKILKYIGENGPASSLDFKDTKKTDWAWGPTSTSRAALELLYATGVLGVHHRVNTRRYFDLTENLLPSSIANQPDPNDTHEKYLEWHLLRRIGGLGIASLQSGEQWLGIRGGRKVSERRRLIPILLDKKLLLPLEIEGIEQTYYLRPEDYERFKESKVSNTNHTAAFIAPLDNLIWDRKMIKEVFEFEYIWEVYKPPKIRQYGYYVLPVLYGDRFIARVDFQHDKKSRSLTLDNWWWEEDITPDNNMLAAISTSLSNFCHFLSAEQFKINRRKVKSLPIENASII